MAKPLPIWLRENSTSFTDIQINLTTTNPIAKGKLGTLTATAAHPCYATATHTYEIWAIEYGTEGYECSSFNRRIILGNRGTKEVLSGFQNSVPCIHPSCPGKQIGRHRTIEHTAGRTLWCMKCWSDDMYESGLGGIGVPPFILYYSLSPGSFLRNLRSCMNCKAHFAIADFEPGTTVFLPLQRKALDDAIEAALQSAGITGTVRRERLYAESMSRDQRQEITAAALRPDRIERIAAKTGMDAWDVLENM